MPKQRRRTVHGSVVAGGAYSASDPLWVARTARVASSPGRDGLSVARIELRLMSTPAPAAKDDNTPEAAEQASHPAA
ncbi:hypothetical protein [Streptomyces collinus]|uniref:hypothetical protein n=1 Tax=Streptomyces collinus TaxID=42684 RepID=UPI003324B10C